MGCVRAFAISIIFVATNLEFRSLSTFNRLVFGMCAHPEAVPRRSDEEFVDLEAQRAEEGPWEDPEAETSWSWWWIALVVLLVVVLAYYFKPWQLIMDSKVRKPKRYLKRGHKFLKSRKGTKKKL